MKIAITGATGGIGKALAHYYAKPNNHLFLTGRNTKLAEISKEVEEKGCSVSSDPFDLRDKELFFKWIDKLIEERVDLVIFCAGVSSSVYAEDGIYYPEKPKELKREMEVNALLPIEGANLFASKALKINKSDTSFRPSICLFSSLAGLTGLPGSPGYSASKAAVLTFGEALRRLVKTTGINVSVVIPGFVESEMSQRYQGSKPTKITAERAAEIIALGLEKKKAKIIFPRYLAFGIKLLELVPERFQPIFLKPFFFTVVPDKESQNLKTEDPKL